MRKLMLAFLTLSFITSFTAVHASHEPPCNHESLDEAWGGGSENDKDEGHHHHHHHHDS